VHDLRLLARAAAGRRPQPSVGIVDSRTRRSTEESGARAGVDGQKRVRGSKVHRAHALVDSMGTLLTRAVTPANEAERQQIGALAQRVQEVTGESVEVFYADAASTGAEPAAAAQKQGMRLVVVQRPPGQPRFCPAPQALGGRAQLRLGQPLPPLGARLRAPSRDLGGTPFRRLHLSLAPQAAQLDRRFITPSQRLLTLQSLQSLQSLSPSTFQRRHISTLPSRGTRDASKSLPF